MLEGLLGGEGGREGGEGCVFIVYVRMHVGTGTGSTDTEMVYVVWKFTGS